MNLESLAKKTTAQREHPPSRFKSFKIGCGGLQRIIKGRPARPAMGSNAFLYTIYTIKV